MKPKPAINEVSELAQAYLIRKAKVDNLEALLKQAKAQLEEVESNLLPSAMESADLLTFTTEDGIKVTVKEDITMSLASGDRVAAFGWLRNHNHADLIKSVIKVEFGKGQDKSARACAEELKANGYDVDQREDAHVSSIKAVLRAELEQGTDIPFEIFGATQYRRAVVKIQV